MNVTLPRPGSRTRPVVFSAREVRATLAGRMRQFRRPIAWTNSTVLGYPAKRYWPHLLFEHAVPMEKSTLMMAVCGREAAPRDVHLDVPYQHSEDPERRIEMLPVYRVRPTWEEEDLIWVREPWMQFDRTPTIRYQGGHSQTIGHLPGGIAYRADLDKCGQVPVTEDGDTCWRTPKERWSPARSMPRRAARLHLRITEVRAQRLGDISEEDAEAEGVESSANCSARDHFARSWDNKNSKTSPFTSNRWFWVITFCRITL